LPQNISFRDLVDAAKLRWRIERDYEELKPNFQGLKINMSIYQRLAGHSEF
jgi:SRSO17 transposase